MVDPTRPQTPAPDAWPEPDDARVQRIVGALTAPATAEELAEESRYVDAFLAQAPVRRHASTRRMRRTRIALAGGVAALAVTGTAAAFTVQSRTSEPGHRAPASTAAPAQSSTPPAGLTGAPVPPTTTGEGATTAPPTGTTAPPRSSGPASNSAPGRADSPSSAHRLPSTPALRAFCRSFHQGKLNEHSKGYRALVQAAGGAAGIPTFCAALDPARRHG